MTVIFKSEYIFQEPRKATYFTSFIHIDIFENASEELKENLLEAEVKSLDVLIHIYVVKALWMVMGPDRSRFQLQLRCYQTNN